MFSGGRQVGMGWKGLLRPFGVVVRAAAKLRNQHGHYVGSRDHERNPRENDGNDFPHEGLIVGLSLDRSTLGAKEGPRPRTFPQ